MSELHTNRINRLIKIALVLSLVLMLTLYALKENIQLYRTPSEWLSKPIPGYFKLGGLVVKNSVQHHGSNITFGISDGHKSIKVIYSGVLPSLFKEGKGVIVEGIMKNNVFQAREVLAKHDENYRPPNIEVNL